MPGQLTITAQDIGAVTRLSGACLIPGDQSKHFLQFKILTHDIPPVDVTSNFQFSPKGVMPGNGGWWMVDVTPQLTSNQLLTIEVTCTHDNTTVTASMTTTNITGV